MKKHDDNIYLADTNRFDQFKQIISTFNVFLLTVAKSPYLNSWLFDRDYGVDIKDGIKRKIN